MNPLEVAYPFFISSYDFKEKGESIVMRHAMPNCPTAFQQSRIVNVVVVVVAAAV